MLFEIIAAGFGGQGILFIGNLLARAAVNEGKNATYLPTYGAAMRGGTANCVVTISDEEIGSPMLTHPCAAIIMNEPSLVEFQTIVRPGGFIVANSSIIDKNRFNRHDELRIVWTPATEIARETAGVERAANMVALGAFLAAEPVVEVASIETILREDTPAHRRDMLDKNLAALHAGWQHIGS